MGINHTRERLNATKLGGKLKPGRHPDGGNLFLVVKPSGARSWMLRLTVQGSERDAKGKLKRRDVGVGSYHHVTLAEAREIARQYTRAASEGRDPMAEFRTKQNTKPMPTFAVIAEEFLAAADKTGRHDKYREQRRASIVNHAFPVLGQMPIDTIRQQDVLKVLGPIWIEKEETARRLKQRLGAIFDWAKAHGHRTGDSPMSGVSLGLPKQDGNVEHMASLPHQRVAEFIRALHASSSDAGTRLCFEFMTLTAARPGEARNARWDEIDVEKKLRTILKGRMKAGVEHVIPLSPRALKIVQEAMALKRDGNPLLFPARSGKPLSDATLAKLARSLGFGHLTAHGFRSTFRNWASELTNFPREAVERALAHGVADDVEAAYLRTDLRERRRALMDEWARYVTGVEAAQNVVPLRTKA